MVVLHTFMALLAGFAVMTLLLIGQSALVTLLAPSWANKQARPEPGDSEANSCPSAPSAYIFVNFGSSFLATAAGGYVTAWVAAANPLIHVLALGLVVLALSALSALQSRDKEPIWSQLILVAISPIGVLAGGLIRLRVLGIM